MKNQLSRLPQPGVTVNLSIAVDPTSGGHDHGDAARPRAHRVRVSLARRDFAFETRPELVVIGQVDVDAKPLQVMITNGGTGAADNGTGSSRLSPRNMRVAESLRSTSEFGTLLFDLLTADEDRAYENRFDIDLLTRRLAAAVAWARAHPRCGGCAIGLFGASTGGGSPNTKRSLRLVNSRFRRWNISYVDAHPGRSQPVRR